MTLMKVGMDPGREFTKALAYVPGQRTRRAHFLSVVGHTVERRLGAVLGDGLSSNGRVRVEHVDRAGHFHKLDRMVGKEAVDQALAPHVNRSRKRDPDDVRVLVAEALLQMGAGSGRDVVMVLGAPVAYYSDVATRKVLISSWDAIEPVAHRPNGNPGAPFDRQPEGARLGVFGTIVEWREEGGNTTFYVEDQAVRQEVIVPGPNQIPNPADRQIFARGTVRREGEYLDTLQGRWSVNGQSWTITDLAVIPEGAGAIYASALGDPGEVKDARLLDATVGVVDVGGYTTDVVLMREKKYLERLSFSIPVGMGQVLDHIQRYLTHRIGKDIPTWRLHGALRDRQVMLDKPFDLEPVIDEAAHALFDMIHARIQEAWERELVDHLLLVGGGMHVLRPYFEERYPMIYAGTTDPEWENAKGFLTFARWNGQWKDE